MTELEHFLRVILGLHPRPVSRREVDLLCDNAALTSALEQKERAHVVAVEEIRQLQRTLDDAQHTIEMQAMRLQRPEAVYRVCYIDGQGFGYIDPPGWARVPQWARARVQVLALCQSEAAAQLIARNLPSVWCDSVTYYNTRTGETRWTVCDE